MPKHYLLSLPLMQQDVVVHCYVMTNEKADMELIANKMMEVVEDIHGRVMMPIMLCTPLESSGIKAVRKIVCANSSDKGKTLREATDFHFTMFGTRRGNPDDTRLMSLH